VRIFAEPSPQRHETAGLAEIVWTVGEIRGAQPIVIEDAALIGYSYVAEFESSRADIRLRQAMDKDQ
jgi:hypothetical protein